MKTNKQMAGKSEKTSDKMPDKTLKTSDKTSGISDKDANSNANGRVEKVKMTSDVRKEKIIIRSILIFIVVLAFIAGAYFGFLSKASKNPLALGQSQDSETPKTPPQKNPEEIAAQNPVGANAQITNYSVKEDESNGTTNSNVECSLEEARAAIKASLVSQESAVYIVSRIRNFNERSYIEFYGDKLCKIYAPTRQEFKEFLSNRKYLTITLINSTVFVDGGEQKLSEQQFYELTHKAPISYMIDALYDDSPSGSTPKYVYNASDYFK